MTSTYHPRADGAVERVHRVINEMARTVAPSLQSSWDEYADLWEFAINNTVAASTGFSPFFLLYGQHPRLPSTLNASDLVALNDQPDLIAHLRLRHLVLNAAKRAIVDAQAKQKAHHDSSREPLELAPGDSVYLSNRPFAISKVAPRWLGPYRVVRMRGRYTCELDLPSTWQIHPIFHVEHLRRAPPLLRASPRRNAPVLDPPPDVEVVLSHRRSRGRGGPLFFAVKFVDIPLSDPPAELSFSTLVERAPALAQAYLTTHGLAAGAASPPPGGDAAAPS